MASLALQGRLAGGSNILGLSGWVKVVGVGRLLDFDHSEASGNRFNGLSIITPDSAWVIVGGYNDPLRSKLRGSTFGLGSEWVVICPLLDVVCKTGMVLVQVI